MRPGRRRTSPSRLPGPIEADYTRPIGIPSGTLVTVPSPALHGAAPGVAVDAGWVRRALRDARVAVDRHARMLTRLDAVLGDGDHGENLATGFRSVEALLDELPADLPPGEVLKAVGYRLVATVGGASGPLYGTAFIEAGFRAGSSDVLAPALIAEMLDVAAAGLARRGRCAVGDKTMLDTLRPAADAYGAIVAAGGSASDAVFAAVTAARRGMRSTRPLVARRGLALRLGPRSAGHLDPGAVSCLVLLLAAGRTR
jgi:phosphoenolpyruvate---glycerone phosphotransferase subunit DhaL